MGLYKPNFITEIIFNSICITLGLIIISSSGCKNKIEEQEIPYYYNEDVLSRRLIFVNGYHNDYIPGMTEFKEEYWINILDDAISYFSSPAISVNTSIYIDGRGESTLSNGTARFPAGYIYASENLEEITANLLPGESINFITHSHGSAYGAGMAQYLLEQGYFVENIIHFAAHDPDDFSTPAAPYTLQLGYLGDHLVSETKPIEGVDRFCVIPKPEIPYFEKHSWMRYNKHVFQELTDLNLAQIIPSQGTPNNSSDQEAIQDNTAVNQILIDVVSGIQFNTEFHTLMIDGVFARI